MKKRTFLALLLLLPLCSCGGNETPPTPIIDDGGGNEGGNEGQGGNEGGGGEGQQDPVEVKKSELLSVFTTITEHFLNLEVGNGNKYWNDEYKMYTYEDDLPMGEKTSSYTWEKALDEYKTALPSGYTIDQARKSTTWDDVKGIEEIYCISGKITNCAFAYTDPDDGYVYIHYEVYAKTGNTLVDDTTHADVTTKVTITENINKTYGFNSESESEQFVEWFNSEAKCEDLVKSVEITGKVQAQKGLFENSETTCLYLGSSKQGGSMVLNFAYKVKSVTVNAQAFWKTYTGGQSVDTTSILYINKKTTVDFSTTTATVPTQAKDTTVEFPDGVSSITLANYFTSSNPGRVVINSITVTYVS